jgi:hypothetical protein
VRLFEKFFKKKEVYSEPEADAREKVLVISSVNGWLRTDIWTVEDLWYYMSHCYKGGPDTLGLMDILQNEYALGRAEVWGMRDERNNKYGRK